MSQANRKRLHPRGKLVCLRFALFYWLLSRCGQIKSNKTGKIDVHKKLTQSGPT